MAESGDLFKNFLTQYSAVRFATGGRFRRPSVLGQLLKAYGLLMVMMVLLPFAILDLVRKSVVIRTQRDEASTT